MDEIMENENLLRKRKVYYNISSVQYMIAEICKDREVTFMDRLENWKCIRGLGIRSRDGLMIHFDWTKFLEKDLNIYISKAKYTNMPLFTKKLTDRSKETSVWFAEESQNEIYEYDCLFDFDAKDIYNFQYMKKEWAFFVKILYENNVCFKTFPSGNNFQLIIPSQCFDFPDRKFKEYTAGFIDSIQQRFNFKHLCDKGKKVDIYKCSYGVVKDRVILPFLDSTKFIYDINNFVYEYVDCLTISKNVKIYKRGEGLINDYGLKNKFNFKKFCKRFYLKW